jgi:hypothetical protein
MLMSTKYRTPESAKSYWQMEYLIRSAQQHESFRRPELEALAALSGVDLKILEYDPEVRIAKRDIGC